VQRPHPPFLVSAQSEESLRWAAQYDIPFAQIDSIVEQAKRDQALYREVQTAHGHPPAARLYLMREIYVADTDTRAYTEARPYLLQYWELWNRYTQFTRGGKLPDSYDFWRRQAPMLHAMRFDQIVANDMVILGGPERVAEPTMTSLPSDRPVSGLRARMIEDVSVRRFSEKTRNDYIRNVRAFAAFVCRSPDTRRRRICAVSSTTKRRPACGRQASIARSRPCVSCSP
jgi:hypothetical protein